MDREAGPEVRQTGRAPGPGTGPASTAAPGSAAPVKIAAPANTTAPANTAAVAGAGAATRPRSRPALRPALPGRGLDPRVPVWIRRAVISAAAAVAVSIWLQWRVGLSAAALVAIVDTVYQSKRMAVIPAAARVTAAQRRTRRRLLLLRLAGYLSLHARAIPGSDSVIDHLVVGPAGVFALDSEYWDRRLPVRASGGKILYHGPVNKSERLMHARWEAGQASLLVGTALGQPLGVRPVMVIYGPTIPWTVASLRGVDVFSGARIRKYFWQQARAARRRRLSREEITRIRAAAARTLPPLR